MSNVIAGVICRQYEYLEEHVVQKKRVWETYRNGFKNFPVTMNPIMEGGKPNYRLSCLLIDEKSYVQAGKV